jgi:hypothetical protein
MYDHLNFHFSQLAVPCGDYLNLLTHSLMYLTPYILLVILPSFQTDLLRVSHVTMLPQAIRAANAVH